MTKEELFEQIRWDSVKKTLKEIIDIPSVTGEEKTFAEYTVQRLRELGADAAEIQTYGEGRCNVIGRVNGLKPGPAILLTGHLDVVAPGEGWETDPFNAVEIGDRIYGRGANDMKAGIALILEAVRLVAANRENFAGSITVALVSDEEAYSEGIIHLLENNSIEADFGISAEPEYDTMLIGAAGKVLLNLEFKGKAAHAAHPEQGINAIEDAAKFIAALKEKPIIHGKEMKGQPYVVLNQNSGSGEYSLVVPDYCSVLINKHTVPGEETEDILRSLYELKTELNLQSELNITVERPFYPPYQVDRELPEVQRICRLFKEETGKELKLGYGDGVCDNNYIVPQGGVPTVCFGPLGGGIHESNEWVSLAAMKTVLKIYLRFLFTV